MKTKLIKIKRRLYLNALQEDEIYLNPAYITAIKPYKDETTRIDYFSSTGAIATNLTCSYTLETVESLAKRINELQ